MIYRYVWNPQLEEFLWRPTHYVLGEPTISLTDFPYYPLLVACQAIYIEYSQIALENLRLNVLVNICAEVNNQSSAPKDTWTVFNLFRYRDLAGTVFELERLGVRVQTCYIDILCEPDSGHSAERFETIDHLSLSRQHLIWKPCDGADIFLQPPLTTFRTKWIGYATSFRLFSG